MVEVKRKRVYKYDYITLAVLTISVVLILFYMVPYRYRLNNSVGFDSDMNVVDNPMMGYAPDAKNLSACENANLVFIELSWAQWEPTKGRFDTNYLERTYNISKYKQEGKHAVLRFVCDIPGRSEHMDIPQWLADECGGNAYTNSYGSGYMPDYSNPKFIEYHDRAITALADYFNNDDFLAFVEMGSIGHWGEWHATDGQNHSLMPSSSICDKYADSYLKSFKIAKLMMRRSYGIAEANKLGIFNDVIGNEEESNRWLKWTEEGGEQSTAGEPLSIAAYPNFWEFAPVGGEFTSSKKMETILDDELTEVLNSITQSHMTFIGPKVPAGKDMELMGSESVLKRLGYRIYISEINTQFDFSQNELTVTMVWENAGYAPFYFDWPVTMNVYDLNDELVYWQGLELKLSDIIPGEQVIATAKIPYTDELGKGFSIGIDVLNINKTERLNLAMELEYEPMNDTQIIYKYVR